MTEGKIYSSDVPKNTTFAKLNSPTSANNSILAGVQYIFMHKILPQQRPLSN